MAVAAVGVASTTRSSADDPPPPDAGSHQLADAGLADAADAGDAGLAEPQACLCACHAVGSQGRRP